MRLKQSRQIVQPAEATIIAVATPVALALLFGTKVEAIVGIGTLFIIAGYVLYWSVEWSRPQFSLRSLLIAFTLAAVTFGVVGAALRK